MLKEKLLASAVASAIALTAPHAAWAEGRSFQERLAGAWSLVSLKVVQGEDVFDAFGPNPRGKMILTPDGHFSTLTTRATLPNFASNNRMQGTPEEYQAVVHGANAHYGTFEVDEENGLITFQVEVSTFPNWDGQKHERVFTLDGDELSYTNPNTTIGAARAHVVWRRME